MMSVSWFRNFSKKFRRCQPLKANSNPPLSPFAKRGISSVPFKPLFGKEGKGRFPATIATNSVIVTAGAILLTLALNTSCDRLPGKPDEAARWKRPTEIIAFDQLYAENCSAPRGRLMMRFISLW
jgi:hypothetical protein